MAKNAGLSFQDSSSRSLPPVNWLRAFEVTARQMSFTVAAQELGVTQSAISQRIRSLEAHFGWGLFHRLPRGLKLTPAGESLVPLLQETFRRLAEGIEEIVGRPGANRLTVQVTLGFAGLWLAPRLAAFRAQHPEIELRLITSVWSAEYPAEGIDLEIRFGLGEWPGLNAMRLTRDKVFPVCSPQLIKGRHRLRAPIDLMSHRLLHVVGFRDDWPQWLKAAKVAGKVAPDRGMQFDTALLAIDQALRGEGVAMGRTSYVADLMTAGKLLAPFDLTIETEEAFYLVAREGRPQRAVAEAFKGWLLKEAKDWAMARHLKFL
jgi:LysR family glycine cleavage system transcriptional activator